MENSTIQAVVRALAAHLKPVIHGLYVVISTVVVGTACIVTMVYNVQQGIKDAATTAKEAKEATVELRTTVTQHGLDIAVLKARGNLNGGGGQ